MGTAASTGTSGTAVEALHHVERLGRYQLVARLGQGGMGTIHLAVAGGLGDFRKLLVVKELRRELTSNERFVEMFLAEAKLAARLDHPNIVQTLEAGQDGERYFLAMEFLDGQPLVEILKRVDSTHAVPTSLLIQILCDVLAGLHFAHELCDYDETPLHIVHRDVNPQNVFVTYHGHVKLVDFGIAKVIDSEMCTTAGVFKGKFPYAAPEQVNCSKVDRRADVFAVGVMLWEILAQRRFAPGQPTTEAIDARLAGSEPRISAVRPDIDPELAAICDHAMEVDPALRYPTADEFRTDLLDFIASRTEMATQQGLPEFMRREFASERIAAHRIISAQVRKVMPDDDLGDSLVRVLTRSGTSTSPGVTGTSALRDSSQHDTSRARPGGARRSDPPAPTSSEEFTSQLLPRRRMHRGRAVAVSVIACCAFVAAYFLVRAEIEPKRASHHQAAQSVTEVAPRAAASPSAGLASPAHPAALASTPSDGLPAPSEGLPSAEPVPAQPPATPPRTAPGAPAREASLPRTAQGSQRSRNRLEDRAGRSAAIRTRPRRARAASADAPADAEAPAAKARAAARRSSNERTSVAANESARNTHQASDPPLAVGDDLRVLRGQRKPRRLSLEDPFQ